MPQDICLFCKITYFRIRPKQRFHSEDCRQKYHYKNKPPRISTRVHWTSRFWAKVESPNNKGCMNWVGLRDKAGYGVFGNTHTWCLSYRDCGEIKTHRISWVLNFGKILNNLWVLHKCDNPSCVNPDHLWLGTSQENTHDREKKGRHGPGCLGESNPATPLKEVDIIKIRKLWATGVWRQYELADLFGVGQSSISEIIHRKTWKHI